MRFFQLFQTPTSPHLLADLQGAMPVGQGGLEEPAVLPQVQSISTRPPADDGVTKRLALVQWASGMGIWDLDTVKNTLVWDDELHRLFGVPREMGTLSYETWRARVLTDDLVPFEGAFQAALGEAAVREFTGDFRIRQPDGTVRYVSCHAWIERDAAGLPVRVLGVNRDITQTKVLEEALRSGAANVELRVQRQTDELRRAVAAAEKASAAKGDCLARMTHELRTPLNSVVAMARLLDLRLQGPGGDREAQGLLATLGQGVDLLLALVNDFLDLAQIEAGELALVKEPFGPADWLARTLSPLAALARDKGLRLVDNRLELAALPILRGDPARLAQVLTNLVGNAIKFSTQGEVRVTVSGLAEERERQDGLALRIDVRDSGPGVPHGEREQIFAPFRQGSCARGAGTGLGLAICKELVGRMGGMLSVGGRPGEGATFSVNLWLPLAGMVLPEPAVPGVEEGRVGSGGVPAAAARVLVAEDHPLNQLTIKKLLAVLGVGTCELVETGPAVLARLGLAGDSPRLEDVDLLLLDCHLPGLEGREVAARIRGQEARHGQARLPIVAVSAGGPAGEDDACLAAGMDAYLAKPLEPVFLRKVLARWLAFAGGPAAARKEDAGATLTASLAPCDLSRLHEFYADGPVEAAAMVGLFLTQAREQLAQLAEDVNGSGAEARHGGDPMADWAEVAHRLKGGAGDMGATGLWRLAAEAQELAEAGPSARAAQLMLIQAEFARVEAWLQARVQGFLRPPKV